MLAVAHAAPYPIVAQGFIGHEVAQAFVRAGHIVYAQTRSKSNETRFLQNEMVPVIADPAQPAEWAHALDEVDVGARLACTASIHSC